MKLLKSPSVDFYNFCVSIYTVMMLQVWCWSSASCVKTLSAEPESAATQEVCSCCCVCCRATTARWFSPRHSRLWASSCTTRPAWRSVRNIMLLVVEKHPALQKYYSAKPFWENATVQNYLYSQNHFTVQKHPILLTHKNKTN